MKKIYLTFLAAIIFWSLSFNVFGTAIQLDGTYKPDNLPTLGASQEAASADHPETAATQTIILYVGNLVSQVLLFTGALTIVFIIIAGAKYVFAYGNDDRLGQAKRGITWSVVGLILILLSYSIVRGVIKLLISTDVSAT